MIPMMIAGGLSSLAGGLFGSRSARQQRLAAQQAEEMRRQAAQQYSTGMTNLASEYQRRARFTPVGVTSGIGRAYQGENGEMVSELSPEYAKARGNMLGLADMEMQRLRNFDPNALAADRFRTMQGLLAPDRALQTEGMFSKLNAKGLTGLSVNDGSGRSYNPLMGGMQRGWADADTRLALESQDWAENQRRTGMGLLSGLYGQATQFDQLGFQNLDRAQNWSTMQNQFNLNTLNQEFGMHENALQAVLNSYNPQAVNQNTMLQGTGVGSAAIGSGLTSLGNMLMSGGGSSGSNPFGMFSSRPQISPWMLDNRARGGGGPGEG
jgi:hypothetical protein